MDADERKDSQAIDEQIAAVEAELKKTQGLLDALKRERDDVQDLASESGRTDASSHFRSQSRSTASSQASASATAQPYYTPAAYVPAKDHVAAGLLAIVFGCFGIHKFYLGYTTPGFIMLAITIIGGVITFGIAALVMIVIGIIEGVIYLTMSQSEFEETHVNQVHSWF